MRVHVREDCKACNGEKIVQHPLWISFFLAEDEFLIANHRVMTEEEVSGWFRGHGRYELPQEKIACQVCDGEGVIDRWMDIDDFKKHLSITD